MRALLLIAVSSLALAACGEQTPAEPTPAAAVSPAETALAPEVVNIPPAEIATKLEGVWQSIDDPNSILTINAHLWINDYKGDDSVHSVDTWSAFPGTVKPMGGDGLTFTPTSTYIQVASGDQTFFYEVGTIEADAFDMFYVGRGNRLAYKRIS